MSTLEKAIGMLQQMPEHTCTAFGIAHKYANSGLIEKEKEAFARAMAEKYAEMF